VRPQARLALFVAFAFTVMADPVSSVTYAIEAAYAGLDGDAASLVPTMALVVATIAVIAGTYHQLVGRFPSGGGGAEAVAAAFGNGWAFLPLGALLVDFTLTIAVSCAAAASALIAYLPGLDPVRLPLAAGLALGVGAACLAGHRSRVVFATATLVFVGLAFTVVALGATEAPAAGSAPLAGDASLLPVLLTLPLGMALATGLEAPSNAIAELGELGPRGRTFFGRATIWLMLGIVGFLTLGISILAVRMGLGLPAENSTLIADVAREATGGGTAFAAFQAASALLLLAAAASSYIAGSGLLEALARRADGGAGLLPERLGRVNRWYVPPWGLGTLVVAALAVVLATGGRDQEIVQFYAVAVFASFLGATLACFVLARRDGRRAASAVSAAGIALVTFVLALNLRRVDPIVSLVAAGLIAAGLRTLWIRRGRPAGIVSLLR
jgi:hypothetical protein